MSAPNDPGHPASGERSTNGTNGSAERTPGTARNGPVETGPERRYGDTTETPPWQRGPAGRSQGAPSAHRPPAEPPQRPASPAPQESGTRHSPSADARLNRFVSGSSTTGSSALPSAAAAKQPSTPVEHQDVVPVPREAYASELPDLSGPAPRPAASLRKTERTSAELPATPTRAATRAANASSRTQVSRRERTGPVRASMQIRRIDPWSALKVSLVLSITVFFIWMIAVAFLYLTLGGMGVWTKLNSNVGDLLTNGSSGDLVSSSAIFGGAALIGLVNIVLLTAAATIGAFIYNLTTDLVGGVEVTLADRD